jgi:CheY-like chemotaxis protein
MWGGEQDSACRSFLAWPKNHGGFVTVSSELRKGTTFQVFLSALTESHHDRKAFSPAGGLRGQGELLLVVDDEEAILRMTRDVLDASGYRVLTATNGAEAVDLYVDHPEHIDLVVMDLKMPVMDGAAAIRTLRERDGTAKILAVSGVPAVGGHNGDRLRVAFLQKPYTPQSLLTTLQKELHHDSACHTPSDY